MRVQVVRIRRHGLRLRPGELDPPETGELRVRFEDSKSPGKPLRRSAILFRLEGVEQRERGLLAPLFDPRRR